MTWDWQVFCTETTTGERLAACFGSRGDQTYLNWIIEAWAGTLTVALLSLVIALAVGLVVGTLQTLTTSLVLSRLAGTWVELFRSIPLPVQVFLWYFVVPAFVPTLGNMPSWVLVTFALGLFTSARVAEQVRVGISVLPRGQRFASLALGMTTTQRYRYVLLPMALRIVIPPLTSESKNIIKDSSVAFAVSVAELPLFARQSSEETAAPIQMYLAATMLYVISAFILNRVMRLVEQRTRVPGFVGQSSMGALR